MAEATWVRVMLVLALAGCGRLLGIEELRGSGGDAGGDASAPVDSSGDAPADAPVDASADASVDAMMGVGTISGIVRRVDGFGPGPSSPAPNTPVAFFRLPPGSEVSRTTAGAAGEYALASPVVGIDGYVLGGPITTTYHATRRYLARPLTPTVTVDVDLYSVQAVQALALNAFGITQGNNTNFAVVVAIEADGRPASGLVVELPPGIGTVRYNDSATQASTGPDGVAFLFNVGPAAGPFVISAIRAGTVVATRQIELPAQTNGHATLQVQITP